MSEEKKGLWENEAARVISHLLRAGGINKAETGRRSRIGQRSVLASGYELAHWKKSKEIDIYYRIGRFSLDREEDVTLKLNEIKNIIENSGFDVRCSIVGNHLALTYKTPWDKRKEEQEVTNE